MEKLNIILSNGMESTVDCLFYLYNSKYYFIYTTKEIDENGYVVLHLVQVGKEIQNTPNGQVDTGNMVGVEISDPEEWKSVQASISKIIEDAKNGTTSPEIQILPLSMITKLKIVSEKTFRLLKDIVVNSLKVDIPDVVAQANTLNSVTEPIVPNIDQANINNTPQPDSLYNVTPNSVDMGAQQDVAQAPIQPNIYPTDNLVQTPTIDQSATQVENVTSETPVQPSIYPTEPSAPAEDDSTVIIDYRARFFEEQEKNNELQRQIDELNKKISDIKNIIEPNIS